MAEDNSGGIVSILAKLIPFVSTIQTLSWHWKTFVSVLIEVVALSLIVLIWQRPVQSEEKAANTNEVKSTGQSGGTAAANQGGSITSTGQIGGMTAGVIITYPPPVTEPEKKIQAERLKAEIEDLSEFRERPDEPAPSSILEQAAVRTYSHQLYIILCKYTVSAISAYPNMGSKLLQFKKDYLKFANKQKSLENDVANFVRPKFPTHIPAVWYEYTRYYLLRGGGIPRENFQEGSLSFPITIDAAESIKDYIASNKEILQRTVDNVQQFNALAETADQILNESVPSENLGTPKPQNEGPY